VLRASLTRWRRWNCERRLLASSDPEPRLDALVSQAVTRSQFDDPIYTRLCASMGHARRLHRKQWEHVWILRALEQTQTLRAGARGLGFGVGREPLVAVLARAGCRVLATDLPAEHSGAGAWRATGQYGGAKSALNEAGLCEARVFAERVEWQAIDMRDLSRLRSRSDRFDFLWSSCALEHLGSLEAGLDFIRASLDLLVPGGVAAHTTELNVTSNERTVGGGPVVLYRRRDLEALERELNARGHQVELNFQTGTHAEDRRVDPPPYDSRVHLKMLHAGFATTSFGLLITRGAES
jgi:2-polyprenyl-3-methyl-5-hydroxy-6-metoxy-1,4-benzoquinol methylase